MRNVPWGGDCGHGPIIGLIDHDGKKYPYGCVKTTDYDEDMESVNARINNVGVVAATANNTATKLANDLIATNAKVASVESGQNRNYEKIVQNTADISAIENEVDTLTKSTQSSINSIVSKHSSDMAAYNTMISQLSNSVTVCKNDINGLNENIFEVEKECSIKYMSLEQRVLALEGGNTVEITSFTASPATSEKGSSVNVVLTWNFTGTAATIKINNTVVTGNTYTVQNVTANAEYTLAITDAVGRTVTKTASVKFVNKILWGKTATATMSESIVKGLAYSALSDTATRNITVTTNSEYVVYALPKRLGTVLFECGGFTGGFEEPQTIYVSNNSGYSEEYYVYRSTRVLSGTAEIKVKK